MSPQCQKASPLLGLRGALSAWDGFYHLAPGLSSSFPADLGNGKEQGEGTSPCALAQPGPVLHGWRSACLSMDEKG